MKERIFDFLLAATVAAVITFVVLLQEGVCNHNDILIMSTIGSIGGFIFGFIKMMMIKFDKWNLLAIFLGVLLIYGSISIGILFNILSN